MLSYQSFGSAQKPLLCFLHGFLGSGNDFLPVIQDLTQDFHCVLLDLPAHGASALCSDVITTLRNTLQNCFSQKPFLIGYSLGGRLSLQLSTKTELAGILALGAHPGLDSLKEKEQRLSQDLIWCHRLKTLPPKEFLTLWYDQPIFCSLQKKPALLQELITKRLYHNPQELASLLQSVSLAHQPFLASYPCPVFFAHGEYDQRYRLLYEKHFSSCYVIPKAGHSVLIENPSDTTNLIKIILQKRKK